MSLRIGIKNFIFQLSFLHECMVEIITKYLCHFLLYIARFLQRYLIFSAYNSY